jgi:rod shape-determining protein MreC
VTEPGRERVDLAVTVLLVLAGSLIGLLSPSSRLAFTHALRASVLAPVLRTQESVSRRTRLSARLVRAEAERDSLSRELVHAREAEEENVRLRELLSLAPAPGDSLVAVQLEPGRVPGGEDQTFMVRAGTAQGVRAPAGVFTSRGLVGVLRSSTEQASHGQYWTHPDFRVSVRTATGTASGIVRAGDDPSQPAMILEGAPYQTAIPAGTVLFTSGLGGLYPPGIPVGTVRSVSAVESGWEKSYRVEPAVRPEQVGAALVWRRPMGP